jgi:hypothetical protein
VGMTRFQAWCAKKGFSKATGYRQEALGNVLITKVGNLSFVTDEDDAEFDRKLLKFKRSEKGKAAFIKVAECSIRKLAELVDKGHLDRDLVVDRLSAVAADVGLKFESVHVTT